jgi:hypothetical protein
MFHVKQFGTIGAENLTSPWTAIAMRDVGWRGNSVLLAIGGSHARCGGHNIGLFFPAAAKVEAGI